MNQKFLKKLPRYCAIAIICAMTAAAAPALAFDHDTSGDINYIKSDSNGNIIGSGTVGSDWNTVSGINSVAVGGYSNSASGANSVVIGGGYSKEGEMTTPGDNKAKGSGSVIVGGRQNETYEDAGYSLVAGGRNNIASGDYSAAIGGYQNKASSTDAVAVGGQENEALAERSAVFGGQSNRAFGKYSATFGGHGNKATGEYAVTLGGIDIKASGPTSVAIGGDSNDASGMYSVVLGGYNGTASGHSSVAIGGAKAGASHSVAIGNGVETGTTQYEVAIGNSNTNKLTFSGDVVEASNQRIANVAAGTDDNDVVVLSQLKGAALKSGDNITIDSGNRINLNKNIALATGGSLDIGTGTKISDGKASIARTTIDTNGVQTNKITLGNYTVLTNGVLSVDCHPTNGTAITREALTIGGNTYITKSGGINANNLKVANVLAGTTSYDAVNYEQLKGAALKSGDNITIDSDNKINLNKNIALAAGGSLDIGTGTKISDGKMTVADTTIDANGVKVGTNTTLADGSLTVGTSTLTTNALSVGTSALTSDALKVGSKTYINNSGINANDKKITNVAKGETGTDAANVGQTVSEIVAGTSNVSVEESTAADGSKKYTVSVTGGGSGGKIYKAGNNINFSGDDDEVINLNDNIALTKDGFVAIGEVSDNNRIVIGADTGEGTKMIVNRSMTDDGKENISFADPEKFSAQALEKGELKKSAIHTVSGFETADFTTPGEQKMSAVKADEFILLVSQDGKVTQGNDVSAQGMSAYDKTEEGKFVGATFNTQLMGISVSQDGKVSYGTGITAKGIEIEDNSDEKVKAFAEISSEAAAITRFEEGNNKQAYMDYDGYFAFSGPKEDTVEKIVGVTTGTTYNEQEYEAGLYVGDETTNELSYLTSDKLTVANKTYIDENGVNANDQKITNLAEGKISTDAARMDQLIELEEGSSVVIEKDGTDPETGKTKYKISAVGEGFLEGGDNINVTGDKINLDDNIQLTKDGSVTIGTENDNEQIIVGAEAPVGKKGIKSISKTDDGKISSTFLDYEAFAAKVIKDGEVKQGTQHTAEYIQFADANTSGVHKASGFTADRLGIEVSQDGKISYGAGLTAKGLEVADITNPEEQKAVGLTADKFALTISKDGGVVQGNGISAKGMEVLEKTEDGKIAGASVNTQVIGIAVSQDGELSYGAGMTAKGINTADHSGEDVNKAAHFSSDFIAIAESDKNKVINKAAVTNADGFVASSGQLDNPDKVVALTTGTSQQGQGYEAGLYIADATKKEHSALTTSELTVANKTYIDKNGINANNQKITNVANGTIAQGSKDAVNGGQLWDTYNRMNTMSKNVGNRLNTIDNNILNMNSRLNDMYDDLSGVGSQAAAMSALQAIPYNPYAPTTVTAGLGFYRSDQAVAVGVYHYIRDSVLVNVGGAFNLNGHGDAMGRAGISFALGKGAGKGGQSIGRDVTEMQNKMNAMQNKIDDLEALVKELKKALDEKK